MNTFLQAMSGFQPLRWSLAFWSFPLISVGDNPKPSSSLWNLPKEWWTIAKWSGGGRYTNKRERTRTGSITYFVNLWKTSWPVNVAHPQVLTGASCSSKEESARATNCCTTSVTLAWKVWKAEIKHVLGNWCFSDDWVQLRHWHMLWLRQYDANNRSDLGKPMTLSRSYSPKIKLAKIANDKPLFHSPRFSWILRR